MSACRVRAGRAFVGAPQTDQTVAVTTGARGCRSTTSPVKWSSGDGTATRYGSRRGMRRGRGSPFAPPPQASSWPHPDRRVPRDPWTTRSMCPVWMPVKVDGTYAFVSVEGTQSEVAAETIRGDVTIKGGADSVSGKSVEGDDCHRRRARPHQREFRQSGRDRSAASAGTSWPSPSTARSR